MTSRHGQLHHVELWVADLAATTASLGWLLEELGYRRGSEWPAGRIWELGTTYVVVEQSPALSAAEHDRMRPGLNHLAFHVDTVERLDALVDEAAAHGWRLLFPDLHPHAGGPDQHAAYLEDASGFEVELVVS